MNSEA